MHFSKRSDLFKHKLHCLSQSVCAKTNRKPVTPSDLRHLPPSMTKNRFLEVFGLLPHDCAKRLSTQCKSDCDVVDIEDDSDATCPPTPRTPKSLISQLSRDLSPTRPRRLDMNAAALANSSDDDDDTDSVASRSKPSEPRRISAVLNIDYSSPLGHRVRKHMAQTAHDHYKPHVDSDDSESGETPKHYEAYCSTPKKYQLTNVLQKLRSRPVQFPVTFKKSRKHCPKICHQFKFTRRQRHEFYLTKESGLDRRSRRLRRHYFKHKSYVQLERLSVVTIRRWMARKPRRLLHRSVASNMAGLKPQMVLHNSVTQAANIIYKPMACETSAGSLTPPSTPEQLQQDMLTALLASHQRSSQVAQPICIDDSDDDVVSISSDDSNENVGRKRKKAAAAASNNLPAAKRLRSETSPTPPPMLLFKCHLCLAEITCQDNFSAYIKAHFQQQHKVYNINLIEHTDSNGLKVVSIVEESPTPPLPAPTIAKKQLFSEPPRLGIQRSNGPSEVICID